MDIGSVFSAIIAVINLIPVIKGLFESFVSYYVAQQIADMKKENAEAIRKALQEHDQRYIEEMLGNPRAGEPSGLPGVVIRDGIVGVHNPKGSPGDGLAK